MKKNILVFLMIMAQGSTFLFSITEKVGALEEWKKPEPTTRTEVTQLRDEAQRELEKATEEFDKAKEENNKEKEDRADLKIKQADYNLKTADVAQTKLDYGEGKITEEDKNSVVQQSEARQTVLDQEINALSGQLAVGYEKVLPTVEPLSQTQAVNDFDTIVRVRDPELKDAKAAQEINKVVEVFDTSFKLDDMNAEIAKAKGVDGKQKAIDDLRKNINYMDKMVDIELKEIKDKTVSEEYKAALQEFKSTILSKFEVLDEQAIALDSQRIGFFAGIAKGIKNWFDRNFDFHKTAAQKGSIDSELKIIQQNKKSIEPIARLFDDAQHLEENATGFSNLIDTMIDAGNMNTVAINEKGGFQDHVDKSIKTIDDLEKKFTSDSDQKNQIQAAYDSLQKLTGDLLAKSKRYKDDSPTLYAKELIAYKNEFDSKIATDPPKVKAFGPNEVYESLGLTKKTLGFDPQLQPEKITTKQIEDAYEVQRKTLGESSYEWQAARNASTIVRDPAGRATYDAFLKDYTALKKIGINQDEAKTTNAQDWLNTQGELSKLEITKQEYDRIFNEGFKILGESMVEVGTKRTQEGKQPPLLKQLSSARKILQDALSRATQAAQTSQPSEGPPV